MGMVTCWDFCNRLPVGREFIEGTADCERIKGVGEDGKEAWTGEREYR